MLDTVVVSVMIENADLGFLGVMTMVSRGWKNACKARIERIKQVQRQQRVSNSHRTHTHTHAQHTHNIRTHSTHTARAHAHTRTQYAAAFGCLLLSSSSAADTHTMRAQALVDALPIAVLESTVRTEDVPSTKSLGVLRVKHADALAYTAKPAALATGSDFAVLPPQAIRFFPTVEWNDNSKSSNSSSSNDRVTIAAPSLPDSGIAVGCRRVHNFSVSTLQSVTVVRDACIIDGGSRDSSEYRVKIRNDDTVQQRWRRLVRYVNASFEKLILGKLAYHVRLSAAQRFVNQPLMKTWRNIDCWFVEHIMSNLLDRLLFERRVICMDL